MGEICAHLMFLFTILGVLCLIGLEISPWSMHQTFCLVSFDGWD